MIDTSHDLQQGVQTLVVPTVGRPMDGGVAVLVWGGGGTIAVKNLHQVVVATNSSKGG